MLPLDNTACGLVFQAFLPARSVEAARRGQLEHFRGKPPAAGLLEEIRQARWAELTSHLLTEVTGQAAPVFDAQGEIVCVMTTITDLGRIFRPEDRTALFEKAAAVNRATSGADLYS